MLNDSVEARVKAPTLVCISHVDVHTFSSAGLSADIKTIDSHTVAIIIYPEYKFDYSSWNRKFSSNCIDRSRF